MPKLDLFNNTDLSFSNHTKIIHWLLFQNLNHLNNYMIKIISIDKLILTCKISG